MFTLRQEVIRPLVDDHALVMDRMSSMDRTPPTPRPLGKRSRGQHDNPTAYLGSVTRPHEYPQFVCGNCRWTRGTRIGMTLTDGTPAVFTSCYRCEQQRWTSGGRSVPVADILAACAPATPPAA